MLIQQSVFLKNYTKTGIKNFKNLIIKKFCSLYSHFECFTNEP